MGEKKKKKAGCTSESCKSNNRERSFAGSLIWSPGTFILFCLMNLPRRWQVCQILKLALRPAVCVLGLMCQKAHLVLLRGLCVLAEQTFLDTFPRQLAIDDFSPERSCRWGLWLQSDPRRRDTFVRCLSVCVLKCEAIFFLPCLSRTWNLKTIWYLVGMIELCIEFFFNLPWLTANAFCKMQFHFDVTLRKAYLCRLALLEGDWTTPFLTACWK